MIKKEERVKNRTCQEFDIKVNSQKGMLGEIAWLSWGPLPDQSNVVDGMMKIGISLKIKELVKNIKCTPKDTFNISITTKPVATAAGYPIISEAFQQAKLIPETITQINEDGVEYNEVQPIPDSFEENKWYILEAIMITDGTTVPEPSKIASTFGRNGYQRF